MKKLGTVYDRGISTEPSLVREHLATVLASPQFATSARLSRFLRYCVEFSLNDPAGRIKEYEIAVDVFDRDAGFDPRLDPIVRVHATRLRAKLKEYYHEQGRTEKFRIVLPKGGGYAALFESPVEAPSPETPPDASLDAPLDAIDLTAVPETDFIGTSAGTPHTSEASAAPTAVLPASSWWQAHRKVLYAAAAITMLTALVILASRPGIWTASAARRSVAVVSFRNLSESADSAWLSTALTEMLTAELGGSTEIRAIPGQNVARMRVELSLPDAVGFNNVTLAQIRRNLGADLVLVGSFLPVGDKIRLDMNVQDTNSGETVQTLTQTDDRSDLLGLVSAMGARIRSRLGVAPPSAAEESVLRASTPANSEAQRLYAQGLDQLRRFDAPAAQTLLEGAVGADPNYPLAHVALSTALSRLGYDRRAAEEAATAQRLSGKLSREEKLIVEARYDDASSNPTKAVEVYQALWRFYPDNIEYGLQLADAQTKGGDGRQALVVTDSLHNRNPGGDARIDMAEALAAEATADNHRGVNAAERAEKLARARGSRLLEANASVQKGNCLSHITEYAKAREAYENAIHICHTLGDQGCVASVLNSEGALLRAQGNLDGADELLQSALATAHRIGDRRTTSATLTNLGELARGRADLEGARRLFTEALNIGRETGDRHYTAISLNNLGNILNNTGDPAGARIKYREGLDLARQIGDRTRISVLLGNLAILDYSEGNVGAARQGLEEALALKRQTGDRSSYAYSLGHLATVLRLQGDAAGSRKALEEECRIYTEAAQKISEAGCRMGLAELDLENGHPELAEPVFRKVASEFTTVNPAVEAWRSLALCYLQMNRLTDAGNAIDKADEIARKSVNAENFRIPVAMTMAKVNAARGRKAEASSSLRENLAVAKKLNKVSLQMQIRLQLGELEGPRTPELAGLEEDARRMGYGKYAERAKLLRQGTPRT